MISIVWVAFGLTLGAAVLHGTLGLWRPIDRTYLSFAFMMALLTVFLYFEEALYRASTPDEAVETVRNTVIAAQAMMACYLVFVPAYLRVRIPRVVTTVWLGALAVLFVANLVAPYGIWFSAPPEVVRSSFRGEPYSTPIAPPLTLLQYAFTVYYVSLFAIGSVSSIVAYRRGERRRGLMLLLSLAIVFLFMLADIIREAVEGTWPYVAEFAFVAFGLIMSVQLAQDFRRQADELGATISQVEERARQLTSIVESLRALERNMHAPLEQLEAGIATLDAAPPPRRDHLDRLRRAVGRLREFSRSIPEISAASRRS
jgi:hypothetical protein